MKVPPGTTEYQDSIQKAKTLLTRLTKGSGMLKEAIDQNQFLQAQQIIRNWEKLSNEALVQLEIATLLHQHMLTGNQVLLKSDGRNLIKVEDLADMNAVHLDPWTLLSMEKLVSVFGESVKDIIEFQQDPPH